MFGGIAAAGAERLIYATSDGNVVTFDLESGDVAGQFARFPLGPDEVSVSCCVVDRDRTILLGDSRNHCVRRFRPDGLFVCRYGRLATPGIKEHDELGVLSDPCSIQLVGEELLVACGGPDVEFGVQRIGATAAHLEHPDGGWRRAHGLTRVNDEFWVAETEGGKIHRFHIDGRHIGTAPLPEDLKRPFRIEFDGYDGVLAIFLAESEQEPEDLGVAQLSLDGEFERWTVEPGEDRGKAHCPFDLAVLPDGRFVVADLPLGAPDVRLQVFSADGRLLTAIIEDRVDLNKALQKWFAARLTEGSAYERGCVHALYSGGSEEHLERARELFSEAVEADPDDLLARLHRARLLNPEEAEQEYRGALDVGADPGDVAARIAECRKAHGDLEGAIEVLREAVEGDHRPEDYHGCVEQLGTWYLERANQ